jgi:hypothetical protein
MESFTTIESHASFANISFIRGGEPWTIRKVSNAPWKIYRARPKGFIV